jgi:hypothetical protein
MFLARTRRKTVGVGYGEALLMGLGLLHPVSFCHVLMVIFHRKLPLEKDMQVFSAIDFFLRGPIIPFFALILDVQIIGASPPPRPIFWSGDHI